MRHELSDEVHLSSTNNAAETSPVVIGIGASAGGVEAISAMLDHTGPDMPAAFVVMMHLSATRTSHLADILARHTTMPVHAGEHGMRLERGHVYVAQPGKITTVEAGCLEVANVSLTERIPTIIDRLFNSLAVSYKECAIGVILSGTGADGALGLKAIKSCGGMTFAQGEDGSAPLFAGMPESAMAAGVVDMQLPVEAIGKRLKTIIEGFSRALGTQHESEAETLDRQRLEICALIKQQQGNDFSGYKPSTFHRRVQRRMAVLQLGSVEPYVAYLKQHPAEVSTLFRDLLISVTSFFRDGESFSVIADEVIPAMFRGKSAAEEVRVWVAGCATGEEAFSLGMLLLEETDRRGTGAAHIRIFATDIDEHALSIARKGRYPSVLLDDVSEERRKQFFIEDRGHFTVQKRLREVCTFSPHNALRDPPFSRIDLVSCRNLMIYLGPSFQDRILPIFHYALKPQGFLFVGMAEGASRQSNLFEPLSKHHRIFRRLASAGAHTRLPPLIRDDQKATQPANTYESGHRQAGLRRQIEARVLQSHAPPYVLINAHGEALFYSSRTGSYLEFSPGAPSNNLLSNARKDLRLHLRGALSEVVNTQQRVTLPEVNATRHDGVRRLQISIEPFEDGENPLYLVLFNDHGAATIRSSGERGAETQTVEQLEGELHETHEQLQSAYEEFETAIEELRVTNEELMSVNEELQSSNEELETSKEELQSVNEEMQTVNHEMSHHVDSLDQANADLSGLLESTNIATIFLDRQLAIRRFTQAATEIFTLIPSDCGRRITDLNHQLGDVNLGQHLEEILIRGKSMQMPVRRVDGTKHYLMGLLTYSGKGEDTSAVVMTFVDITALAQADERHKTMIGELNHRVRNMLAVVSAMAQQTMGKTVPGETLENFLSRLQAMARTYKLLTETNWSHMSLRGLLREELGVVSGSARYAISGPEIMFDPREALALGMVIHELATNALKYGALSNDEGRLEVTWRQLDDADDAVEICWQESDGPTVETPQRRGFGTVLIERQLAYELNGNSELDFASEGLRAVLRVPRLFATQENA